VTKFIIFVSMNFVTFCCSVMPNLYSSGLRYHALKIDKSSSLAATLGVTKFIYFCNDLVTLCYSSKPNLYSTRDKMIDKSSSLAAAWGVIKFMIFVAMIWSYFVILQSMTRMYIK
jgi:hypothetical protein